MPQKMSIAQVESELLRIKKAIVRTKQEMDATVGSMEKLTKTEHIRKLLRSGISPHAQCMQALGYKEMVLYLEGIWTLEKAIEEIQKGSRHYAKRQGTFLRREPAVHAFQALDSDTGNLLDQFYFSALSA